MILDRASCTAVDGDHLPFGREEHPADGHPVEDFEVNARGTLNVLEAIRAQASPPPLLFTSTNKVYGALEDVGLHRRNLRYEPTDASLRQSGVSENRPLDFHSPYGCSKGTADQYVLDYARSYGLPAIVFRMSCIYGAHQFGTEDQGWVAHFLYSALQQRPVVIYGDGCQVRDVLCVTDLVRAFDVVRQNLPITAGQIYNVGGGLANTTSLLELINTIEDLTGCRLDHVADESRPGDQLVYVTDYSKLQRHTGWRPLMNLRQTLGVLQDFWEQNRAVLAGRTRPAQIETFAAITGNSERVA